FVIIRVQPQKRAQVYENLNEIPHLQKAYRVTGEIDVISIVNQQSLDEFLRELSKIDGIISTSAHIIISQIK
ncbi:MAG: Lrp/AsnC ligand binding domain-containing protein, partial [Endomicrobiia bacterium]